MTDLLADLDAHRRRLHAQHLDLPPTDPDEEERAWIAAREHHEETQRHLKRLRAAEDAQRLLRAEKRAHQTRPALVRLDQFLAEPNEDPTYRIDKVWPTGGRLILAAQFKAGKTTMIGNLLRALADGSPFLDRFEVRPHARIVLIDNELDQRTLRAWLADQGIENTAAIRLVPLRGRLSTFDIRDPDVRAEWAADIAGADVVILDCLRPVLDALGLDESHEAGKFLIPFDELLAEAGATEAVIVHHMGHTGERERGDSRLKDWADATWKLVRDKDEDDPTIDNVRGSRYFSAFGRGVDHPQSELTYHPDTRHLTLGEAALSRREATAQRRVEKADQAVAAVVREHPGINKTKLRHDVRTFHGIGRNEDIDQAVERLVIGGLIVRHKIGNTSQHYPGHERLPDPDTDQEETTQTHPPAQPAQPAPAMPGHTGENMPARPIGAGMIKHQDQEAHT